MASDVPGLRPCEPLRNPGTDRTGPATRPRAVASKFRHGQPACRENPAEAAASAARPAPGAALPARRANRRSARLAHRRLWCHPLTLLAAAATVPVELRAPDHARVSPVRRRPLAAYQRGLRGFDERSGFRFSRSCEPVAADGRRSTADGWLTEELIDRQLFSGLRHTGASVIDGVLCDAYDF